MQLNHTILEAFDGLQIQGHVAVTSRYQWNAIPNKHWGHTDDELVDRLLVKKGGDELASAHQPERTKTKTGVRLAIQASHPHPTSPKGSGDVRKPDPSLQSRRIYQRRRIDRRRKRKRHRDGIHWHSSFQTLA